MSKILFGVSGSIAAMKAAQAVSKLVQRGHEVQIVATLSALKFVGSATWEGLTDRPVLSDTFTEGHQMDHIHLARWADVYVLAPASANALAQWARGLATDLPSTLFLAFERSKPILVAPAMNREMWSHPAVQANLQQLEEWHVQILRPVEGPLACGEVGAGRLVSPEVLVDAIETATKASNPLGDILITAGATREPIDGIRFLTNVSSGRTGAAIADHLSSAGWRVTYLHGIGAQLPQSRKIETQNFSDFRSLQEKLRENLGQRHFHFVLQAAAISDFSIANVSTASGAALNRVGDKLSSGQELHLTLSQNPKLVLGLKEWSRSPDMKVIAFKLTHTADQREQLSAVHSLLNRPEIDAVVWNDLSGISPEAHLGQIFWKNSSPVEFKTKSELAERLNTNMKKGQEVFSDLSH